METLRELVKTCTWEYVKTYSRLRILGGGLEVIGGELGASKPETIAVIVKSVREVSFDEIPVFNAIISSLFAHNITPKFYEYDMMAEGRGRYEELGRVLEDSMGKSIGVIAVLPYLAPIPVLSRISESVIEALDSALKIQVTVEYENLLYIPEERGEIEVVGKENSESSYERVEWLKAEAGKRGFKRVTPVFLPDNKSIFDYVTSLGPRGIYKRVPVTKLSSYIVALARCYSLGGIEEVVRGEVARHFVYISGVPEAVRYHFMEGLRKELKRGKLAIPIESVRAWIEGGSRRIMGELIRRFGLE